MSDGTAVVVSGLIMAAFSVGVLAGRVFERDDRSFRRARFARVVDRALRIRGCRRRVVGRRVWVARKEQHDHA